MPSLLGKKVGFRKIVVIIYLSPTIVAEPNLTCLTFGHDTQHLQHQQLTTTRQTSHGCQGPQLKHHHQAGGHNM